MSWELVGCRCGGSWVVGISFGPLYIGFATCAKRPWPTILHAFELFPSSWASCSKDSFLRAIFSAWTVVILDLLSVVSELFEHFSTNVGEAGLVTVLFFWPVR